MYVCVYIYIYIYTHRYKLPNAKARRLEDDLCGAPPGRAMRDNASNYTCRMFSCYVYIMFSLN